MINRYFNLTLLFCLLTVNTSFGQCTEAKDADMAKYKRLTETQDAQGCSQCAMLALYFCSARHCVEVEDKRKVRSLIEACKGNIINMGQPYCCPELVNKEPEWGVDVGSGGSSNSVSSTSTPPQTGSNTSSSSSYSSSSSANYAGIINRLNSDPRMQGNPILPVMQSLLEMYDESTTNTQSYSDSEFDKEMVALIKGYLDALLTSDELSEEELYDQIIEIFTQTFSEE
jgi:hypothetical protein